VKTTVELTFTLEMQIQDTLKNLNEDDVAFNVVMYILFFKFIRNSRVMGRNG